MRKRRKQSAERSPSFYLGYGEPLIGFCPYFRHAHTSAERFSAVTWQTVLFCWFFLLQINQIRFIRERKKLYWVDSICYLFLHLGLWRWACCCCWCGSSGSCSWNCWSCDGDSNGAFCRRSLLGLHDVETEANGVVWNMDLFPCITCLFLRCWSCGSNWCCCCWRWESNSAGAEEPTSGSSMAEGWNSGIWRKGLHEFCNSQQGLILLLSNSLFSKQYFTRLGKENGSSSSSKVKEAKQAKELSSDSVALSTEALPLQLLTMADRSQSSSIFITSKVSYKGS